MYVLWTSIYIPLFKIFLSRWTLLLSQPAYNLLKCSLSLRVQKPGLLFRKITLTSPSSLNFMVYFVREMISWSLKMNIKNSMWEEWGKVYSLLLYENMSWHNPSDSLYWSLTHIPDVRNQFPYMLGGAIPSVLQDVSVSGYFSAFLNSKCKEVDAFPYMWWDKNNHQRE